MTAPSAREAATPGDGASGRGVGGEWAVIKKSKKLK